MTSIAAGDTGTEVRFRKLLDKMRSPRVLELGTLQWEAGTPTHHEAWAPHAAEYVKSDVRAGVDVDVVADAHTLDPFDDATFDALICCSVLEHLARPWVAADQFARVLRPGGVMLVSTHQSFPLHGYPHDYFRFSTEALAVLFGPPSWSNCHAGYAFPCQIVPPSEVTRWNTAAPAWLNVEAVAVRADRRL